jgi:pyruvate dehydrogenase E1 component
MMERRKALGGSLPKRRSTWKTIEQPADDAFGSFLKGSGGRAVSTTMAFTGLLRALMRDKQMGKRVVPIIPDEARTFGMDPLFSEFGIYAPFGQLYDPVDAGMLLTYKESKQGQILEEGITEAGSLASAQAAGTSYATWGEPTVPFFTFYSMFGFQRVGDLIWQFGDIRGRGFLCGGTAGRTTLNGEGLQHEDGHSHILASTIPNLRAYDPAFAYEIALIVQDGIRRMYGAEPEDLFYYLTLYNENYAMPEMPAGVEDGVLQGLYKFSEAPEGPSRHARILFSGPAWKAAIEARDLLAAEHDVAAECWSATSYKLLREDALSAERWSRLHPTEKPQTSFVAATLGENGGPVVAVSEFMKALPEMIARWVPGPFVPLGTDGYGRSDTRAALRRHFEVDAEHVVVATLHGLSQAGDAKPEEVAEAIIRYEIDAEAPDPRTA